MAQKILLIRFSSIGDIVLTTPVVRTLKDQLGCELHTLTRLPNKGLYENNPYVDKVFVFEKSEKEAITGLQKENYDFVVDLQKNIRSARVRRALGVPAAAFPKLNIEKWMLVNLKINRLPDLHVVDRYFEAVKRLGVKNDLKGLDYFIPAKDKLEPEQLHQSFRDGYVAFVIGGQHATKIFLPEKVAGVINKLSFPVVLLGGKEDVERGEEIVKMVKNKIVVNACGKFSLNASASLVEQCKVLVTNDTGLMHIGAAFRKPVVSVWGNTVPEFGMYPYMPGDENKVFISEIKGLKCRPCSKIGHKKCPKGHFRCMMEQDENTLARKVMEFYKNA
jgi:heptosyltransferase-2